MFGLSTELITIKVNWPPYRDLSADVSSISSLSERIPTVATLPQFSYQLC